MGMGFVFGGNPLESPNIIVPLVMFGWLPLVVYLFMRFPARQAVVISFFVAWLFLPQAGLKFPAIPEYNKISATCYGILLATFIFDVGRFQLFKFSWLDIPILVWCFCPFASSMMNELGPYDGVSATFSQVVTWGIPYFLGRIYLNNLEGLRLLAIGFFMGGLAYIPLCLFEVRMSPQLHRIVYGGSQFADFSQSIRFDGYRPMVFMQHGLAVGAFMMAATLIGIWLWQAKVIRKIWNVPVPWLVGALFITFILVKSSGAYILLLLGLAILFVGRISRTSVLAFVLMFGICFYLYMAMEPGSQIRDQVTVFLSNFFDSDRMQSLTFRFDNERQIGRAHV